MELNHDTLRQIVADVRKVDWSLFPYSQIIHLVYVIEEDGKRMARAAQVGRFSGWQQKTALEVSLDPVQAFHAISEQWWNADKFKGMTRWHHPLVAEIWIGPTAIREQTSNPAWAHEYATWAQREVLRNLSGGQIHG